MGTVGTKMGTMSPTEIAAWWGAIIATLSFAWNIYRWVRGGARLRVNASPNMKITSDLNAGPFISVEVTNSGDRSTTITTLHGQIFSNSISVLLRRPQTSFVVPQPMFSIPLPYVLEPGNRWTGMMDQLQLEKDFGKKGILYCGIIDSVKGKSIMKRVRLT